MGTKMTPRQRCALLNPVKNGRVHLHERHYRRNGYLQSILTFDLFSDPGYQKKFQDYIYNGNIGVWHGRVSHFPAKPIDDWGSITIRKAKIVVTRLVNNVGDPKGELKFSPGKEDQSFHVFTVGTKEEVCRALEANRK